MVDTPQKQPAVSIMYIDMRVIKGVLATAWCGTPAMDYRMTHGMPSPQLLMKRAARIEAHYSGGIGEQKSAQ